MTKAVANVGDGGISRTLFSQEKVACNEADVPNFQFSQPGWFRRGIQGSTRQAE